MKAAHGGPTVLLAIALLGSVSAAEEPPPRYATTPGIESDRCATAWVILRYLDPEARIEFHAREAMPSGVILFDLPEAELRRDARRATLEALIARHQIKDQYIDSLARLIHDIEINAWARRDVSDSDLFERVLMAELGPAPTVTQALQRCLYLLDRLRSFGGDIRRWAEAVASPRATPQEPRPQRP